MLRVAADSPPPVLDSAHVLFYVLVPDSIEFRRGPSLYVGGILVGRVPRLAICENLGKDIGPMLFHCKEEWDVVGTSGAPTIEETKQLAERNYPGIGKHWQNSGISRVDAQAYYDLEMRAHFCSFCGKRPYELNGPIAEGNNAMICHDCVERLHTAFDELE